MNQGAFDDVTLHWLGVAYTIPANKMMGAIARIEDHVTMPELQRFGDRGTVPMVRLSSAFASVLTYVGARDVTAETVYSAMFGQTGGDAQMEVAQAIQVLLGMMVPRSARSSYFAKVEEAMGEQPKGNPIPAANASSPKPTKSRSGKSGSPRKRSGR